MTDYLLLAFIFLCAGVVAVPIASRLGLGSVLGYLVAGIIIGPLLEILGVDVEAVRHFAEFGVVMMLFLVGLELRPALLWRMRSRLLGLGGLQVVGTTLGVALVAWLLGQPWQTALAIGVILSLSSTAIVLQTLGEKGLIRGDGGQASFAVLLFQDIAVIPILALLPLLAISGGGPAVEDGGEGLSLVAHLNAWQASLATIAAIAAVILVGRGLAVPIFRWIARSRLRELFTSAALMMVIGVALIMSLVGLSPALGTFLAGVMLADSEYRHELEADIEPFRGLLLGVFFITVGAGINFALLTGDPVGMIGLTLGVILFKMAVLLLLGAFFELRGTDRWLVALGLAQAGEFGFVLLAFSIDNAVLTPRLADRLQLVIALSMLLTPLLFILYERVVAPHVSRPPERETDAMDEQAEVIIAGHGRFGGIVNRIVSGLGYQTTVIDFSAEQVDMLTAFGLRVHYGDATRPDLLKAAGIEHARLLVVAIDDKARITELVSYVKRNHPNVHVLARAYDRFHVYELWAAGSRDVVRETYDSALRAGRSALEALGMSHEEAERKTREFERLDRGSMIELAELHSLDRPNHENPAYAAKVRELQGLIARQLRHGAPPESEEEVNDGPAPYEGRT
jgi:CPA2 family monovalent cation:H+ antiporter-2